MRQVTLVPRMLCSPDGMSERIAGGSSRFALEREGRTRLRFKALAVGTQTLLVTVHASHRRWSIHLVNHTGDHAQQVAVGTGLRFAVAVTLMRSARRDNCVDVHLESAAPEMVSLLDPSGGFSYFVLLCHWLSRKPAAGWVKDHNLQALKTTSLAWAYLCSG